jgi:PAS domain-containing protein
MDDGDRSSSETLRLKSELSSLEERVALAETLGVGFWDWDVQSGAIRRIGNGPAFLGDGFDDTPMTTMAWAELIHPEDLALAHRAYAPCIAGERDEWLATLRLRRPDGSWQWMQVGGRVVTRDENRLPLRVLGVVQDNKALKLAEDAQL